MTPACFSADFHAVERSLCVESFTKAETSMSFVHKGEVFVFLDIDKVLVSDFPDIVPSNHHGVIFSHSGNYFVHLGLILDDWLFNPWAVVELFAPTWVTGCSDYGQRVHFGRGATDMLPNRHHCSVTYFRVSLLLYLPRVTHGNESTQHVPLGNLHVVQY